MWVASQCGPWNGMATTSITGLVWMYRCLSKAKFFHSYFREARWFSMVPLLHFFRGLLGPGRLAGT